MMLPSTDWPKPAGDSPGGAARPLDWHGLAARIAAAAAFRQGVGGLRAVLPGHAASFDPASAARLAGFGHELAAATARGETPAGCGGANSSSRVNRVDSGEGKSASAIGFGIAGVVKTGGRGLA